MPTLPPPPLHLLPGSPAFAEWMRQVGISLDAYNQAEADRKSYAYVQEMLASPGGVPTSWFRLCSIDIDQSDGGHHFYGITVGLHFGMTSVLGVKLTKKSADVEVDISSININCMRTYLREEAFIYEAGYATTDVEDIQNISLWVKSVTYIAGLSAYSMLVQTR
jgi:hypothetical protein